MLEKSSIDPSSDPRSPQGMTAAFQNVRQRLRDAAGGREITLVAATKTVDADRINFAIDRLGLTEIGENRVQELLEKYDALHKENLRIHFIGRLQSNKVKYIVDKVCMIHSLDSLPLAGEIEKQCARIGKEMDVLTEINLGGEASKGGIRPDQAEDFIRTLAGYPHLRPRGIMVIPPPSDHGGNVRYFTQARRIFETLTSAGLFGESPGVLSMGMSDSFEDAVACGSTLVRVGSALFGKRNSALPTDTENQSN